MMVKNENKNFRKSGEGAEFCRGGDASADGVGHRGDEVDHLRSRPEEAGCGRQRQSSQAGREEIQYKVKYITR